MQNRDIKELEAFLKQFLSSYNLCFWSEMLLISMYDFVVHDSYLVKCPVLCVSAHKT